MAYTKTIWENSPSENTPITAYTKTIWENSPSENTPITAENLNNIENGIENISNVTEYLTATARSDGDFKLNIPNTLETGMIVNITFPAATVGTANARLSIDNETNYYNIYRKSNTSVLVLAKYIQNNKATLYFDGTNFIFDDNITKVLFDGSNGGSSTLSLSETSDNFYEIEIQYYCNSSNQVHKSCTLKIPNNKKVCLDGTYQATASVVQFIAETYTISGASITRDTYSRINFQVSSTNYPITVTIGSDTIFIQKVIGKR